MKTITSASGREEAVTVRRSESADARGIDGLVSPAARAVFGRINVISLLEKANLAVTVADEKDDVVAHASFFDHPFGDLVDQAHWEHFLQKHFRAEDCTPLNTLFLHLFVAQTDFTAASVKEIMRAVFNAVAELEHVCLVGPHVGGLEPALDEIFEPMQRLTDPGPRCSALICHRRAHCPRLLVRPARVEDHDEIMSVFKEQTKLLSVVQQPFFLSQLIEARSEDQHNAVCEVEGVAVGFISVSAAVDLKQLHENFDLSEFDGLNKVQQQRLDEPAAPADPHTGEEEEKQTETSSASQQDHSTGSSPQKSNTFCIQLFAIDKDYETRSLDFIPHIFKVFPDLDFCIITVPYLSPEFPLLQNFVRVPSGPTRSTPLKLYMLSRAGLGTVKVRPAVVPDRPAVCALVKDLSLNESLLQDLDHYYETRSDRDAVPLQAFVAQVDGEVVGILILRDEQDIEYIRAHYNIENFIYFSHHGYEEHAQMLHFVLQPSLRHFARHLFKEVLRLAHKSCLYHRVYPPHSSQENSCVHHLDVVLDCAVPVRPRRQIIYPLEELGINGPSRRITEDQVGPAAAG